MSKNNEKICQNCSEVLPADCDNDYCNRCAALSNQLLGTLKKQVIKGLNSLEIVIISDNNEHHIHTDRNITVITGCPNCGYEQLDEDYKYCSQCKHDLKQYRTVCVGCGNSRLIFTFGQNYCCHCTEKITELQSQS